MSKCSSVINMSTSRTLPPSCMYCFGELSLIVGTPANILLPSERDSASSSSKPPPRAKFLKHRGQQPDQNTQNTASFNPVVLNSSLCAQPLAPPNYGFTIFRKYVILMLSVAIMIFLNFISNFKNNNLCYDHTKTRSSFFFELIKSK